MVDLRLFFRLAFFLVVDLLAALDLMALAGVFAYASLICVSFSTFFFLFSPFIFREDAYVSFFCARVFSWAASFALCRLFDGLFSPGQNLGMA